MKIYRKPFYKTYMMVILGASIITFVLVSPVLVEHFNMALSNGVDIDYLIKTFIFVFVPCLVGDVLDEVAPQLD